jgi:uncharacterized membrane protein YccC
VPSRSLNIFRMQASVNGWGGLRVAIITGALVALCVATDHPGYALPLASGSLFTGMAEAGEATGHRWRTMLWATFWLTISAFIGGLLTNSFWAGLVATAVVASIAGLSGSAGPRAGLIGLLGLVVFTVYLGAPDSATTPLQAALLITAGGLLQSLAMIVPYLLTNPGALRIAAERQPPIWPRVRAHLHWPDPFVNHAVRLTLAVTFATAVADSTNLEHQYWLPMTVAWVTQSGRLGTTRRVIARVLGTAAGLVVVFVLLEVLKAQGQWLSVICAIFGGIAVAYITANYIYAVLGVTVLVLTLLFMDGDPLGTTMWQRLGETVVAGVIAIIALSIWPDRDDEDPAPGR